MLNGFEIKDGVLKRYYGTETDVVIPDGVTEIGDSAFESTSVHSVSIPNDVTIIGHHTFESCENLTCIKLPNGLKEIGVSAFENCNNLTSVSIPDSVIKIGFAAFRACTALFSIKLPEGITKLLEHSFDSCTSLRSINIPESVTIIGDFCFFNCQSIVSIVVPNNVRRIGYDAFYHCLSATVICGEKSYAHYYCEKNRVKYIFDYQFEAFHGVLSPGTERLSSPFLADEEKPYIFISYSHRDRDAVLKIIKTLYESGWKIWYDEGLTIGDKYDETLEKHVKNCSAFLLFITKDSLESLYIKENEIPWAIEFDKPIIKCIVDDGLDFEINNGAVIDSVDPLNIEPALEKISGLSKGEKRKAKGISVVVNPADRNIINGDGFAYCLYSEKNAAKSKAIILEAKNSGCAVHNAVENGENDDKLKKSACLIVMLDKAFLADRRLTNILIEEYKGGKDIAVCQLEEIEDSDLPKELIELHLMQWLNFTYGITGDMTTKLARHLQNRGCRNTAILPGFKYEKTGKGIVIKRYTGTSPNPKIEREYGEIPVVEIGKNAFENCIHLKEVTIPESVNIIGNFAFSGCSSLTSIVIPQKVKTIEDNTFKNCSSLASVVLPGNLDLIEAFAFCYCTSLTSVTIPNRVTEIGSNAFSNCTGLISVVIPDSVQIIGWYTFDGCTSLTDIIISDSVTEIGRHSFRDCPNLTVTCPPDSCAWKYCMENGIPVKAASTDRKDKPSRPSLFGKLFGKK